MAFQSLTAVPLFSGLRAGDLVTVRRVGTILDLPGGRVVWVEGDQASAVVVLIGGEVSVWDGHRSLIGRPGSYFGAVEVIAGRPYEATVRAAGDVRLIVFESRAFLRLLDLVPVLSWRLLRQFARRTPADPWFGVLIAGREVTADPVGTGIGALPPKSSQLR